MAAAEVRRRISARKTLPPRCLGGYPLRGGVGSSLHHVRSGEGNGCVAGDGVKAAPGIWQDGLPAPRNALNADPPIRANFRLSPRLLRVDSRYSRTTETRIKSPLTNPLTVILSYDSQR